MRLALGTVQFGLDYGIRNSSGKVSKPVAAKILDVAKLNQINVALTPLILFRSCLDFQTLAVMS